MPAQSQTSWVEIDLAALHANVQLLRRLAAPARVAAVVKADAYGHGAVPIAQAALDAGAATLCVFTIPEAIQLREAGIAGDLLCLGPLLDEDFGNAALLDIAVTADSPATVAALAEAAFTNNRTVRVHLNLDSGMHRYGRSAAEVRTLAAAVRRADGLHLAGLFTHFPDAANPAPAARAQAAAALTNFQALAHEVNAPLRHAAASAAAFNVAGSQLDLIRAGLALYGIHPSPNLPHPAAAQLQPVLSWRTRLLSIRDVAAGEAVSYGGLWTATADTRIGVIGAGYADGLARALSPGGALLVRGTRCPLRGAVCMDSAMIDLTDAPHAQAGDTATIIGRDGSDEITAWDLANHLGTIPYEVCTSITARVPRRRQNERSGCGRIRHS